MGSSKHDQVFFEILKEERSVVSFLDSVFGFLYRCTDFYQHQHDTSKKVGFPVGVASEVVQKMFQRYERQTRYEEQSALLGNLATAQQSVPSACQEVELNCEPSISTDRGHSLLKSDNHERDHSEVFNGDDRENYRWSQTISDIDVFIPVENTVVKAKQIKIKIEPHHLKVVFLNQEGETQIIDKEFPHKVKSNESVWSLVVGEHVQIHLEKNEERWWDRLFSTDPPIDTKKIDTMVMASELSQEDHMRIEELVVNQKRNIHPPS